MIKNTIVSVGIHGAAVFFLFWKMIFITSSRMVFHMYKTRPLKKLVGKMNSSHLKAKIEETT